MTCADHKSNKQVKVAQPMEVETLKKNAAKIRQQAASLEKLASDLDRTADDIMKNIRRGQRQAEIIAVQAVNLDSRTITESYKRLDALGIDQETAYRTLVRQGKLEAAYEREKRNKAIQTLFRHGVTKAEIARRFKLSKRQVGRIVDGLRQPDKLK